MRPRCAPVLAATVLVALACGGASTTVTAQASVVPGAAAPAASVPAWAVPVAPLGAVRPPTCATGEAPDADPFPVRAEIADGSSGYRPGGAPANWRIELTNTTAQPCARIHPIVVLVDRARTLTADQVRLEFRDPEGKWRPAEVEHTDRDENVGILADGPATGEGFHGFVLSPGAKLSVDVRLAFAADTRPDPRADAVEATVALVQRRGGDGEWVGESDAYEFALDPSVRPEDSQPGRDPESKSSPTGPAEPEASGDAPGRQPGTDPAPHTPGTDPAPHTPGTDPGSAPRRDPSPDTGPSTGTPRHDETPRGEHGGPPPRLAETGDRRHDALARLAAVSAVLTFLGAGMVTATRRSFGRSCAGLGFRGRRAP
ncbi:hypothetical protein DSC45_06805 [Streptomyces sp. YIM 130001]|uniref:hypothetical protein n=1 Tax=Streptomyces sp. YIM 130001 TaxID=2259644 RepID=UPI000E64B2B3|nr:hypothetical protein [Streptomyces sp. YIM 130001]RII19703.1 hypothetical protein DSC45_06805 [Streptomyces sp. YIM 130001]